MINFTKEQLIARINQVMAINKFRIKRDPEADGLAMDNELFAIALASLEAEPVYFVEIEGDQDINAGRIEGKNRPDLGLLPDGVNYLYAAPPAPVSVPVTLPCPVLLEPGLRFGKGVKTKTMLEALQRRAEYNADLDAMTLEQREQHDAGMREFAAMLQGDEPVTTAYKLRDAVDAIRNSGIAIDGEKILAERDALNSPVIPYCWCRTCRPVTIADMRFVVCPDCGNKRCPKANDHRNECTGSNEPGQEGSAYPAAPQKEVK